MAHPHPLASLLPPLLLRGRLSWFLPPLATTTASITATTTVTVTANATATATTTVTTNDTATATTTNNSTATTPPATTTATATITALVGKSTQNSAEFHNHSNFGPFELRNFHRNFIFLIVKYVPANSEHVPAGLESSPAIDSSNFMNWKTFPPSFFEMAATGVE
jgi:hypothetical protein